ncbi:MULTISPECIES: hypothetical protein [Pseudomonas]|jgi:5,10-methenyltetrahydromethanopterin hydrogenase|uniref:hypothetical protein n=1 Tax=Pseudomonas TaxID=286 RepID=UPI0006CDB4B8|nr:MULTISPECIES: hypothetical protein [Pseudomonas]KPG78447.1 hypothetical protein AEQ63_25555 [Pseudomonas sp. RIT-PI-o]WPC28338.1 hypothetical protein OE648_00705 [Pseudomonas moraviensis]
MEKRLSDRDDSIIPPVREPSEDAAKEVIAQPSSIIFCIDPDDPIIGKIRAGRRVSYEVMKSDTGQQYAINVRLVRDKSTGKSWS